MAKRNWKRARATSLQQAMELCIEFAKEKHNRSMDRIAEGMGLTNKWTLYKWIESGGLPVRMVRPFEDACGCEFVSRYLAASAGKLVVEIPTGRRASAGDVHELQDLLNAAVGSLIKFYGGKAEAKETLASIMGAMEGLALHRENIAKAEQPELDMWGD